MTDEFGEHGHTVMRLRERAHGIETGDDADVADDAADAIEALTQDLEELRQLRRRYETIVNAVSFENAVSAEARRYHDGACVYGKTLDRIWEQAGRTGVNGSISAAWRDRPPFGCAILDWRRRYGSV